MAVLHTPLQRIASGAENPLKALLTVLTWQIAYEFHHYLRLARCMAFLKSGRMILPEQIVSIHPYFRIKPGRMQEAKVFLRQMVARTSIETANLYYDFTIKDDVVFCREAYVGAEGLMTHIENVGAILAEYLKIAEILRVEVHGSREDIEKLKGPLAHLNPEYFVFECGVSRQL